MTKKTFYEKVGRRYKPVLEYDQYLMDSFPKGAHLVIVRPGERSVRYSIDPSFAPMIAAGRYAEDAISQKIMDKSALRIPESKQPITKRQQQAWETLQKELGDDRYALEYCSYREAAEAGVNAMLVEAEKMLENPAVRRAWNNFMLIWQLTKESEK